MKSMMRLALGAVAVAAFGVVAAGGVQAACSRVSATGEALTKELATEVAKMNLDFALMTKGTKGSGPVQTTCGAPGPLFLTTCTAKQKACS